MVIPATVSIVGGMNTPMTGEQQIAAAKQRESEARRLALLAAEEYRKTVLNVVSRWKAQGISKRRAAERIGISESALRELLRPAGYTRRDVRRSPRARKTEQA